MFFTALTCRWHHFVWTSKHKEWNWSNKGSYQYQALLIISRVQVIKGHRYCREKSGISHVAAQVPALWLRVIDEVSNEACRSLTLQGIFNFAVSPVLYLRNLNSSYDILQGVKLHNSVVWRFVYHNMLKQGFPAWSIPLMRTGNEQKIH